MGIAKFTSGGALFRMEISLKMLRIAENNEKLKGYGMHYLFIYLLHHGGVPSNIAINTMIAINLYLVLPDLLKAHTDRKA